MTNIVSSAIGSSTRPLDRLDTFCYLTPGFKREARAPRGDYGQAAAAHSKIDETFSPDLFRTISARGRGRCPAAPPASGHRPDV
jgi:hypothetical protein